MDPEESLRAKVEVFKLFCEEDWPTLRRNNRSGGEWGCRVENSSGLLTRKSLSLHSVPVEISYPVTREHVWCSSGRGK